MSSKLKNVVVPTFLVKGIFTRFITMRQKEDLSKGYEDKKVFRDN